MTFLSSYLDILFIKPALEKLMDLHLKIDFLIKKKTKMKFHSKSKISTEELMIQLMLWIFLVFVLGVKFYRYCFYRPEGFPPGPPRIPFFGAYLLLMWIEPAHLYKAVIKLCDHYKSKVRAVFKK